MEKTKRTSPLHLPESLIHERLGRFAPSTIAKQYFTSCASVHPARRLYLIGKP